LKMQLHITKNHPVVSKCLNQRCSKIWVQNNSKSKTTRKK
jgi:hypothetical protein